MIKRKVKRFFVAFLSVAMITGTVGDYLLTIKAAEVTGLKETDLNGTDNTAIFLDQNRDIELDTTNEKTFQTAFKNYIAVDGTKLMDGENELKFVSLNYPQATSDTKWEQTNAIKTIKTMGGNVTRSYTIPVYNGNNAGKAYVTGVDSKGNLIFNEDALKQLDQLLAICNKYGVRLIIPLVDHWHWVGGIDGYVGLATGKTLSTSGFNSESWRFYSDKTCIDYFKQMIKHLMNRTNTVSGIKYKDDPAVICWETGNELGAYNQEDYDEALFDWTNSIVDEIKENGAKQLVLDGRMSMTDRSLSAGNHADILGCHYYTGHYPTKTKNDTISAHAAGKPFILGEFGGYTDATDCQAVFEAALESGTNGTMMWSLRAHKEGYGYYFHPEDPGNWAAYHWPGFPSGEYYDEADIIRTIYAYAQIANGKAVDYEEARQIPIPVPESSSTGGENPLLYDITTVGDIKWRGVVGGAWYEIQRADGIVAETGQAEWTTIADKKEYVYDSGRNWEDKNHDCIAGFHDITAITGKTYSYRLRACNESGAGEWSNIVTTENAVHEIYDDMQMIAVSSNDVNPEEIRNVYSYDHSANVTTSGGTLQNTGKTSGYIGYTEGIPIKDVTITTTSTPEVGNEPKLYVSKDDITYTEVALTTNSGTEYVANNISEAENIYYARIYINGENTCILDSVKIIYTYIGKADLNPLTSTVSKNVIIQDNTFGEDGAIPMYVRKTDNVAMITDGEVKGLATTNEETAIITYKTADDITAYRVTAHVEAGYDLDVEVSMDGINYSKVAASADTKTVGKYTKYIYANVDVSDIYRVVRVTYPAGRGKAVLESVEVSSGSKRLPMSNSSPANVIEDGEFYFGSNTSLQAAYTTDISKGLFLKTLSEASFEEYDALYAWIKNDNSGNTFVIKFTDANNNVWTAKHILSGLSSGMQKFDFEDFKCADSEAVMNLSSIKNFSMGIELVSGTISSLNMALDRDNLYTGNYGIQLNYTWEDGKQSSVYIDNIYISSLTKVDDYEGYNGASSLLQAAYRRNTGGGVFDMALDVEHKHQGSYGLKIDYNYEGTGYAGATKSIDYLNLKDFDGLMVYYESDGSGNSLTLQIKDAKGLSWESIGYMDAKGPTVLYMPFESFKAPSWDSREGSFDKEQNITEFSIYTNKVGSITSGTLYFDDIKGAKFVDDLAANATVTVDTPSDTTVTSLPYAITGTAGYVDYINLQIGDIKRNVPVNDDGTWSFNITEDEKIYNGTELELSAKILYHNGDVIKEDTRKRINIAVTGNDKPVEVVYETAWQYNFSTGLGNWVVDGFTVSDGAANKIEDNNFLTWSNDAYSGTLTYTLEVPNGIYTLGNDIRVKSGMNIAKMALKSGDTEFKSSNLNTEDTMLQDQRLGQNIEVRNGQIQIIYYIDAPSGGMVFALNNVNLYKVGEINYVVNGAFDDLSEEWPNLPNGWDIIYTGGDGYSPVKGDKTEFVGYSDSAYTFKLSQELTEIPIGVYQLKADIKLNNGTVNSVSMGAIALDGTVIEANVLDKLDTESYTSVSLNNIAVKDGKITIYIFGDVGTKGIAIDNVSLTQTGNITSVNYVTNPSFEDNGTAVTGDLVAGWVATDNWGTGTLSKTEAGGYEGDYALSRWNSEPYWAANSQELTNLPEGIYNLTAWAQSKAAETGKPYDITQIIIKVNNNITSVKVDATGAWKQYAINNIEIHTGDAVVVTIYTNDTVGGGWTKVDLVNLIRVGDIPGSGEEENPNPGGGGSNPGSGNDNTNLNISDNDESKEQVKDITIKPSVETKLKDRKLSVDMGIDADQIIKASEGNTKDHPLKVTIVIPNNILLGKKNINKAEIVVTIPKSIANNGNIEISQIVLEKEIINAAKTNKTTIDTLIKDEYGKLQYSWSFDGKKLASSKGKVNDINLSIEKVLATEDDQIKEMVKADKNNSTGLALVFRHDGRLPVADSIKIHVEDQFKAGKTVYVYAYNKDTNKYESLSQTRYKVDKEGYVTIVIYHGSKYVLTEKAVSSNIITTLAEQTSVAKSKNVKVGEVSKLSVELPDGISLEKAQITYKTSNKAVVTVSKSGRVAGKKKGTATITTTVIIGLNKKVFQTKVTIKK